MKKKAFLLLPVLFALTSCEIDIKSSDITSKLIPNWVSFVTQLAALVVLIIVVIIFAYKPVKKIIQKRQDYIESNIKEAEKSKSIWKENELKSKETVLSSERQAADIVANAKVEAENQKAVILEEAQLQVNKMKQEAEKDIKRMEQEAQEDIRKEIVNVALDASTEILGREISSEDNSRLVEEFVKEVKKK